MHASATHIISQNIHAETTATLSRLKADNNIVNGGFVERFVDYFNTHAYIVVTIWFIVFLAKLVNILTGLIYIQRIKHVGVHQPPVYWSKRLQELVKGLRISKPVQLLESELLKVPAAVGLLKPVILLPVGLCTQLPPDQLEAILLHELAHIKRRDYFVNLLQSFAVTIYFFNPAVIWVSSLIKAEREHCCDDIAIGKTGNSKNYITALVSFQEYTANKSYAMAFPGEKNHLLHRVRRIIEHHNKTLNHAEKLLVSACMMIMISGILFVRCSKSTQPRKAAVDNVRTDADMVIMSDKTYTVTSDSTASQDQIVLVKQKEKARLDEQMATGQLSDEQQKAVKEKKQKVADMQVAKLKQDMVRTEQSTTITTHDNAKTNYNSNYNYTYKSRYDNNKYEPAAPESKKIVVTGNLTFDTDAPAQPDAVAKPKPAEPTVIIKDMMADNLIANTSGLSYKLSRQEFIINGVKQPESVHKKFSDKYVINKGWAFVYNWSL